MCKVPACTQTKITHHHPYGRFTPGEATSNREGLHHGQARIENQVPRLTALDSAARPASQRAMSLSGLYIRCHLSHSGTYNSLGKAQTRPLDQEHKTCALPLEASFTEMITTTIRTRQIRSLQGMATISLQDYLRATFGRLN